MSKHGRSGIGNDLESVEFVDREQPRTAKALKPGQINKLFTMIADENLSSDQMQTYN